MRLLGAGAEEDFVAGASEDVGADFRADTGEETGADFGADTGEEASEDFGADVEEDVGKDFDSGVGEDVGKDFGAGGRGGFDRAMGGSRSLHASGTGGEGSLTRRGLDAPGVDEEDKAECSLALSLTRRGLDAPGGEDVGADVDEDVREDFGAGACEDAGVVLGANGGGDAGATSGGFCGAAGMNRTMVIQRCGKAIIFYTPGESAWSLAFLTLPWKRAWGPAFARSPAFRPPESAA